MQALSSILTPVIQGVGLISNILQGNRQWSVQQNAINEQKKLQALTNDPAAYAAKIQQLQQPLSQGLQKGVENEVQGYLGERGLGLSPQISEQVLAQALGPYQLQEQKMAQDAFLAPFGIQVGATNAAVNASPGFNTIPLSPQRAQLAPNWNQGPESPQYMHPPDPTPPGITYPNNPIQPPAGADPSFYANYNADFTPYTEFPGASTYQPGG